MKKNSNFTNYCMLLMLWFWVIPLMAQEETWEQMNGPYGGNISYIVTGKNGSVCAATDFGGVYVSNDYGSHWTERINASVNCLAANKDGKLYAGGNGVLYTSVNDGLTWAEIRPQEFSDMWIAAIAIDSSNRIYLGGYLSLFRSDDGGESWININNSGSTLRCLVTGPPGVVFAGYEDGVYRSFDYGKNWSAMNSGLASLQMRSIVITNSGKVLASTYGFGVFRSTINGDSWENVLDVFSFCLTIDTAGNIFHGSLGSGIYKSVDEGTTWIPVNDGLGIQEIRSLAVNLENNLYAGTQGMGVFRSFNQGLNWEETNNGLDNLYVNCMNGNSKKEIFTGSPGGGIQKSNDGGVSWSRIAPGLNSSIYCIDIDTSDRIFMSNQEGGFISENDGKDWQIISDIDSRSKFAFSKAGYIVAASHYTVKISDGYAKKWTTLLEGNNSMDVVINDSNYIFASSFFDGVNTSKDFGATWNLTNLKSDRKYFYGDLFCSKSGSLFVAAFDSANWTGKVFRSDDYGTTWAVLSNGLPDEGVHSFTSDINDCIYAGTSGAGVYRSCDNGNSWAPFNNGLKRMHISSVYIDHEGYLYAGSDGGDNSKKSTAEEFKIVPKLNGSNFIESNMSDEISGSYLFKIKTGGANSVKISKSGSQDFILEQNFPNPFSQNSTIRFKLSQTENVSLKIYNSLGQIISTPVNGIKEAGLHEVLVYGTEMPAGVYYYRLQTQKGSIEKKFIVTR